MAMVNKIAARGDIAIVSIGSRIRERRERANLTQLELANAANIHPSKLSRWESGRTEKMDVLELQKLAAALGIAVSDIAPELSRDAPTAAPVFLDARALEEAYVALAVHMYGWDEDVARTAWRTLQEIIEDRDVEFVQALRVLRRSRISVSEGAHPNAQPAPKR